jgi:2-polyprenyl-6-methoxyphenol hydroxylase-like FAD-dependent oxidoreductase
MLYEQARIPRTKKVVKGSQAMARLMQLENPFAINFRNSLLKTMPTSLQIKRLEWIVAYNV